MEIDHQIEFHEIKSWFFQEIERTIMRSIVVFSGDRILSPDCGIFHEIESQSHKYDHGIESF